MNEIWRPIRGYIDYKISNLGRVKSLKFGKERILKLSPDNKGRLGVILHKNGKPKCFRVHQLVALAFIPKPLNKHDVKHLNGDRADNRVENLEWATHSENVRHAFDTGLRIAPRGKECSWTKLADTDVLYIRENPEKLKACELAKKFGVTPQTITYIQCGKVHRNVGGTVREARKQTFLTADQRAEVKRLRAQGFKLNAIAEMFDCGITLIWRTLHRTNPK